MRQMKSQKFDVTVNVKEHIILRNFWEYFITDRSDLPDGIFEALVMGFETEMGDVSMDEIRPYILSKTKKLDEVLPASGWEWVK